MTQQEYEVKMASLQAQLKAIENKPVAELREYSNVQMAIIRLTREHQDTESIRGDDRE